MTAAYTQVDPAEVGVSADYLANIDALQRRFAQRHRRRVQQAVGQGVGQELQHFLGIAATGQLLAGTDQGVVAGGFAQGAQALERFLAATGAQRFHVAGDLQVDDRLRLGRGLAAAAAVLLHGAHNIHRISGRHPDRQQRMRLPQLL